VVTIGQGLAHHAKKSLAFPRFFAARLTTRQARGGGAYFDATGGVGLGDRHFRHKCPWLSVAPQVVQVQFVVVSFIVRLLRIPSNRGGGLRPDRWGKVSGYCGGV
jgi:hypothetical protein